MKITEVTQELDEYQSAPDQAFDIKVPSNTSDVGTFVTVDKKLVYHNFDVKKCISGNMIFFYAVENDQPTAEVVLDMSYKFPRIKKAFTFRKQEGIMTGFYTFIARNQGIKFTNDTELSYDAELFWKSLIDRHTLNVSIIDIKTGENFLLTAFGKTPRAKTSDGVKVVAPNKDNKLPAEQRFFYLAERSDNEDNADILLENGWPRKKSDKNKLEHYVQPRIMFGPPWE